MRRELVELVMTCVTSLQEVTHVSKAHQALATLSGSHVLLLTPRQVIASATSVKIGTIQSR